MDFAPDYSLLFTMDRYRTKIQLAVNTFLPLEIYTLILYFNVWPFFVRGTIVGTVTVVVLFLILYLKIQRRVKRRRSDKKRWLRNAFLSVRVLVSLMLSVVLIVPLLGFISKPEQNLLRICLRQIY